MRKKEQEVVYTYTQEGVLTNVNKDEYERGDLKFVSKEGTELGRINVTDYQNMKNMPYKEPLVYIVQLLNYLKIFVNAVVKVLFAVPLMYFWIITAVVLIGGVEVKALTVADILIPELLQATIVSAIIAGFIITSIFYRQIGYENIFETRFRRLLNKQFSPLKDHDQYKLRWESSEV